MDWQSQIEQLNNLNGFDKLLQVMAMLRDPDHGCPWDVKQTFNTIAQHTIEEAYELADAIDKGDINEIKQELGDLLFQSVFYSQIAKEQQLFDIDDIANTMCDKLIFRHPHVFNNETVTSDDQIKQNWEQLKSQEREQKQAQSQLDDIPIALPALSRAYKMQKRAANVGFDWPDVTGALDKVSEEIDELKHELTRQKIEQDKVADELGDLYFALVNVTRHLKLKPEQVLTQANNKFERRFRQVEKLAAKQNLEMNTASLEQLDGLWDLVKQQEKAD